ncbi:transmembrane protein 272-like [Oscarella lobularis]|uniref:transmembrane protein 272-like n=1 Tax=Oscarella lobularis TaxID=121494 RepID=UPI003313D2CA
MEEKAGISQEAAPPSYSESQTRDVPPPSYDSLFGRIRQQKETSSGSIDFFRRICVLLTGTIFCSIGVGILMALPITAIVIGAIYLHDCPCQRYIPIYLIVLGSFGIVRTGSSLLQKCFKKEEDDEENYEQKKKPNSFDSLIGLFLFAWFICGNVWIYSNVGNKCYRESGDITPRPDNYCDNTLYLFAFWLTTSTYILLGTICFCGIFFCCCAGCKS